MNEFDDTHDDVESGRLLLESIVISLVSEPLDADVEATDADRTIIYSIDVDPDDRGKIIGRGGCIFQSIETLMSAWGGRHGRRVVIDLIE